jgi:hypothetical protein
MSIGKVRNSSQSQRLMFDSVSRRTVASRYSFYQSAACPENLIQWFTLGGAVGGPEPPCGHGKAAYAAPATPPTGAADAVPGGRVTRLGALLGPGGVSGESAYKPGSVESNHSSGIHVAVNLKRPTRKRARIDAAAGGLLRPCGCFPIWPCSWWGLPCRLCCQSRGALLPHRFTLAVLRSVCREVLGGLLSVALSVGSRPPGVTWHLIRRSPDFPPSPAA